MQTRSTTELLMVRGHFMGEGCRIFVVPNCCNWQHDLPVRLPQVPTKPGQGRFPLAPYPELGLGSQCPQQAVLPAVRGEGNSYPWDDSEAVTEGGEALGQLRFKLPLHPGSGIGHRLHDGGAQQGIHATHLLGGVSVVPEPASTSASGFPSGMGRCAPIPIRSRVTLAWDHASAPLLLPEAGPHRQGASCCSASVPWEVTVSP